MIAYIMNFVHNDRLRTVHDEIQTGKAKKEDPVKQGLEELQRILPHLGSPGEGKV